MFNIEDIVTDSQTYKPEAIRALRAFKALKTFKPEVTSAQRLEALSMLVNKLAEVYEMPITIKVTNTWPESYETEDGRPVHHIVLAGRLSIISLLNRFAEIRGEFEEDFESGRSYVKRQRWAVNLFRKVYPNQFARLHFNPSDGGFYTEPVESFEVDPGDEEPTEPSDEESTELNVNEM